MSVVSINPSFFSYTFSYTLVFFTRTIKSYTSLSISKTSIYFDFRFLDPISLPSRRVTSISKSNNDVETITSSFERVMYFANEIEFFLNTLWNNSSTWNSNSFPMFTSSSKPVPIYTANDSAP